MKTLTLFLCSLILIFNVNYCLGSGQRPTEQLKPTIENLIAILSDTSLQGKEHTGARRQKIMTVISDGFDFTEMSRRVLGTAWNRIGPEQQRQFVKEMTTLLENVYIGRLESYSGEKVRFVAERIKGNRAQVTTLVQYQGDDLPIHYIMHQKQSRWMVYDINIEGISLVRNYKEQFRSIMQQEKIDGLIQLIKAKNLTYTQKKGVA